MPKPSVVSNIVSNYTCPDISDGKKWVLRALPSSPSDAASITVGCTMMELVAGPGFARDAGPIHYVSLW